MISRSIGFSSFSLELFHQFASEPELVPEQGTQASSPLSVDKNDPPTVSAESIIAQESKDKETVDTHAENCIGLCEISEPAKHEVTIELPPEKRQKIDSEQPPAERGNVLLRLWSNWQHPTVYTVTVLFGDPEKPLANAKQIKKGEIVQQLVQRNFPDDLCRGSKEELLRRLQEDIPHQQFQIDGREDLSRCVAMACSNWSWPFDTAFSATMPFRGSNVLGVKHFFDIFAASFLNARYKMSNPAHLKTIKAAIRSKLPRLKEDDIEQLTTNIAQNQVSGELLSDIRQLTGIASVCGHRYREINGRERTFHLDLNTLALQQGDVVDLEISYKGSNVFLMLRIDEVQNSIPLIPEISLQSHESSLPTRARLLNRSWHPPPKLPESFFDLMKTLKERNAVNDQLDATLTPAKS